MASRIAASETARETRLSEETEESSTRGPLKLPRSAFSGFRSYFKIFFQKSEVFHFFFSFFEFFLRIYLKNLNF